MFDRRIPKIYNVTNACSVTEVGGTLELPHWTNSDCAQLTYVRLAGHFVETVKESVIVDRFNWIVEYVADSL